MITLSSYVLIEKITIQKQRGGDHMRMGYEGDFTAQ